MPDKEICVSSLIIHELLMVRLNFIYTLMSYHNIIIIIYHYYIRCLNEN